MPAPGRAHAIAMDRGFSLEPSLIRSIFDHAKPLGHHESADDLNLGFGFLYYGLVRSLRPRHVLVIGSGFGFSVVCLALGLKDNDRGNLHFVDPSYSVLTDGPRQVVERFARFGVEGIVRHHRQRSDEYFAGYDAAGFPPIDLAFIDGSHAYADVRNDFLGVLRHARRNTYILLHDTNIYVREIVRHAGVKRWLRVVQRHSEAFETIDFPFASGVAIVRVVDKDAWKHSTPP